MPVTLEAPLTPGDYEIDRRLVQEGDGPLERCGVRPLRVRAQHGG